MERFVVVSKIESIEYREVDVMGLLDQLAKRANQKAFGDNNYSYGYTEEYQFYNKQSGKSTSNGHKAARPYLHSTFLAQQETNNNRNNHQQEITYKRPAYNYHVETTASIDHRQHASTVRRQVPMTKHVVAPINSDEAAKIYGGTSVIKYFNY